MNTDNKTQLDTVIVDLTGTPLPVYHGSQNEIKAFEDKPTYFTPRTDYGYIKNSPFVYQCYLVIKNPYYVSTIQHIERIRSNPQKVQELIDQGYDGMIYAMPSNLLKGASGWGNDCSQIIAFSSSQIIDIAEYRSKQKELQYA